MNRDESNADAMNDQPEARQPSEVGTGTRQDVPVLRGLAVPAPANALSRFRRRATLMQGTRMLFESQVTGFWVVLDAFLRLLLGGRSSSEQHAPEGDRA